MNWKRAILLSALLYAVSFLLGIIGAAIFGVDLAAATEPTIGLWLWGIGVGIVLTALISLWYFKTVKPSLKEGLYFGLVIIATSVVLDALLIIPYILTTDAPVDVLSFYADPFFWLTVGLIVATAAVVGKIKEK